MPPTPTTQQHDRALNRLAILSAAQAIRDPELNRALTPFRGHPPTALMCGNASCTTPFLWCALDPTTGRIRFSATGQSVGEPPERGAAPTGASSPTPPRPPAPYDAWDPREDAGESIAQPGEPLLRWRFRCPRCDRPCALSNARMIALIVVALSRGAASITPAAE